MTDSDFQLIQPSQTVSNSNSIIYIAILAGAAFTYVYLKNRANASPQYTYEISTDGIITKAINLKTNQVDFQDINSGTVIQNAINTNEPKLHIKPGLYKGGFIQGKPNLVINGEGRNTIYQLSPNSNTTTLDIKSNSSVKNLVIDGNKTNQSSPGHCINMSNASNITVQNLYVKNSKGWDCINTDTCSNINILSSEIEGSDGFGTRLLNSSNCLIDGNNYHNCGRINIDLDTSSNNRVTNNVSYTSNEDGIALDFNSTNNLIQGNISHDNLHYGIATDTVHLPHLGSNTIDNNQVYSNGWDGIIAIRGDYNIISNNKCHDNLGSGILLEGRIQSPGTDNTGRVNYTNVYNNQCYNNDYGIREFYFECKYNIFNNNDTYNNRINQMLEGYLHNIDDKCAQWSMINKPNYTIHNNTWGIGNINPETECIFIDNNNHVGWNWNRPNGLDHITYPNVNVGVNRGIPIWTVFPKKVSEFNQFNFTLKYSYPQLPTGIYNLAPEIYLRSDTTYFLMPKAEIMFYIDHSSSNPGIDFGLGTYLADVNDGNLGYQLYYRTWANGWRLYTFVRNGIGNTTPGPHTYTVNIKYMLDYMSTHNLLNTGTKMIEPSWYTLGFECGNEIYNGTGKIEISQLNINVNGQQITI